MRIWILGNNYWVVSTGGVYFVLALTNVNVSTLK